ncbi:olfactory receptor 13H1-like [Liasis olivaceus]
MTTLINVLLQPTDFCGHHIINHFGFVTYGRIGLAILRISSTLGRRKAFSTCSSHLAVVSVFYGTLMIMYLRPEGKSVSEQDKVISLTYGALTPMLNPLIYSLRNKDHHLSPLCFCSSQLLWKYIFKKKFVDNSSLEEHWERMGESMIGASNESLVTEFILIGLSEYPRARIILFCFLLVVYLVSFLGNGLIIILSIADPQLHTPMYFFICVLSAIDFILTNNVLPEILINCFIYRPTISFSRCLSQMYLGLFLVITECIVLAIMAYDRLAAICQPLYYTQIMSWRLCIYLVATSVALALMMTLINVLLQPTDFCGHHIINHFGCELQSLLKLACSNTVSELYMHVGSLFVLIPPFCFIVVTYGRIGLAILRISSTLGRRKAFSTCSSHLAVVSVFYGTLMIMYLRPEGKSVSEKDKVISLTYGALTPMLNPLIYSLRNKDVKGAFWKMFQRKMSM